MATARTAEDWLATVQAQVLRGELAAAQTTLAQALTEHSASTGLRRAQAGVFLQAGQAPQAETLLCGLLAEHPGDAGAAFTLARMLQEQARTAAAASVLRACFADAVNCRDANLAINAIELLDDCDRKADAAAIAHDAIASNPADARLRAYAGMLDIQLGAFASARENYLYALTHDERAWEWRAAIGLSATLHYTDATHPDFALLQSGLQHPGLTDKARVELLFALGKLHDDIGDCEHAARYFRDGNGIAKRLTTWSRKTWRRTVQARLAAAPIPHPPEPVAGFTPVFIVGMPRSGTTLLAKLLSRHPRTRNRGELPWIARLAAQADLNGAPSPEALQRAAAIYALHARQDDAADARWFIDKQPLNFRYVDLMLAMFPDVRVIHCQRSERDTALSLWMQCFLEDVQGYAYDLDDIATVMRDSERLMAHWRQRFPEVIRSVRYEQLVADPDTTISQLAAWIGLPDATPASANTNPESISTASLWQARQPINARSVGRWQGYAPWLPELSRFKE